MKTVLGISLGDSAQDYTFTTRFLGTQLRVQRVGCKGSTRAVAQRLQALPDEVVAVGLGLEKEHFRAGGHRFTQEQTQKLLAKVKGRPATTGARLADLLQEWAVRHTQVALGHYFDNARVLFLSGLKHYKLALALSEYTSNLQFADPVLQLGAPKLLGSLDNLQLYATGAHYVQDWQLPAHLLQGGAVQEWTQFVLRRALQKASVLVAEPHELDAFGLEELAGKTIITSGLSDERLERLGDKGVHLVVDGAPQIKGHVVGPYLLDAMVLAATGKAADALQEDDYLGILTQLELQPRLRYPQGFRRVNRFAFVIHPLSQEYFKKVKPIELLSQVSPPVLMDSLEKLMAYAPPFVYSSVKGIRSPTGVEAEGWLISVGGTPKEIMAHDPEFTYRRLLEAADMAKKLGAQIMGLGAFTKVVGDAGLTVAKRAPLPITTGNSYSASGALWAAHDAMLRMALLPKPDGQGRVAFQAMVVGATGAIGSVCARLLAMVAQEVTLVSPETAKLLALKESILQDSPDARLVLAAKADPYLGEMDMIVTATSGAGKKVLDIEKVKPGCVITDVARPLDLPPSEVAKRPDVLVIESGEIRLPGQVQMKNIGLPPNVAYACLAETIVLALEGRFENFTVGRAIEWEKVREIYKLGLKHGMQLAEISGVNGPYSDEDIARVRTLALAARKASAPTRTPAKAALAARRQQPKIPPTLRQKKTASPGPLKSEVQHTR